VERRHRAAAAASRAGARALGLTPFVDDDEAAVIVTTLRSPDDVDATSLVREAKRQSDVALSPGFGDLSHEVIRIDHTGERARLDVVISALQALGHALGGATSNDAMESALDAASKAWTDEAFAN
jgi:aspartate aminotransferase-like enzyme